MDFKGACCIGWWRLAIDRRRGGEKHHAKLVRAYAGLQKILPQTDLKLSKCHRNMENIYKIYQKNSKSTLNLFKSKPRQSY